MIYEYLDYRDYLENWIAEQASGGYGLRKKMADYLGCQGAFVSQVLQKVTHFSVEHGFKLNRFLQHSPQESDYFVLLLLYQRAGSEETRHYFKAKIDAVHQSRLVLKNRVRAKEALSAEDKARYYSAWYYGAIRLLVTIPGFQKREEITAKLRLSSHTVSEALDFLLRAGLIAEKDGKFIPTEMHLHLGNDSALITQHHMNWRLQAMNAITEEKRNDLHYSLGVTLSREDVIKVKARLVDMIDELQSVVRPSPSETLCGFCLDWFELS